MRVLVLTGAGVSAESGIPTFRGKGGYWRNLDPTKLATPEAFERDPQLVWEWYRERRGRIRNAQPNAAHKAIAKLAQHANEFLLVTQNVDDLHARAGLPKENMVQIHGDIFITRCSRCDFSRRDRGGGKPGRCCASVAAPEPPESWATKSKTRRLRSRNECEATAGLSIAPTSDDHVNFLRCPKCDALMRPGVVWFGEQLPWKEVQRVEDCLDRGPCDVVIVAGTTATFGYIVDWALRASSAGELIEVNPEKTPLSRFATRLVRDAAAIALPQIVDRLISAGDPRL
jgi:NAD-dependent deacetylase